MLGDYSPEKVAADFVRTSCQKFRSPADFRGAQ